MYFKEINLNQVDAITLEYRLWKATLSSFSLFLICLLKPKELLGDLMTSYNEMS